MFTMSTKYKKTRLTLLYFLFMVLSFLLTFRTKLLVPFNQTKLTKIFQPFLSGIGTVSMILNINPSSKLFDETTTALEFSATASDVIINTEEARKKFRDSYRRMTQIWLQSSKRWSSFARVNELNYKPSVSTIMGNVITEEEEENDLTLEDISLVDQRMNDLKNKDFNKIDPLLLEKYRKQNEFLTEQLEAAQDEMINLDLKIRGEIGKEVQKMMEEMAKQYELEREDMHQEYKDTIDQRSKLYYNRYKKEEERLKNEIDLLKERLFKADKENISLNEKIESLIAAQEKTEKDKNEKIASLNDHIGQLNQECQDLRERLNNNSTISEKGERSKSEEIEPMKEMLLAANTKVNDLELKVKELTDTFECNILRKNEEIKLLTSDLVESQEDLAKAKQKLNDITNLMQQAEQSKREEMESFKEQILIAQKQLEILKNEEIEVLQNKLASASAKIKQMKNLLTDNQSQIKIKDDQLSQKDELIATLEKKLKSIEMDTKVSNQPFANAPMIDTHDKNISATIETNTRYTLTTPIKRNSISTITEFEIIKVNVECQTDLRDDLKSNIKGEDVQISSTSGESEKMKELERQCKQYEARIEFKGKILTELQEDYRKLQEKLKETELQLSKYQSANPIATTESQLPFAKLTKSTVKSKSAKRPASEEDKTINMQEEYLKRFAKAVSKLITTFVN